ncbi:MAG: DMT family transporter [Betaproteobacteria bacterium]|nr:DMT family transporter [Betaproteobacteria bacterium]MCH9849698.1 DMT family transporter [Betaproteobacteria bacterium]
MLVAALGFATMGALVKVGSAKFSSAELVFYRSLFGFLLIFTLIRIKRLPIKTPHLNKQLARALIGFVALLMFFYAISHLPLATAITLNYTSPLFLAAFMPFMLLERPKKILYLAILMSFIGIILLLKPSFAREDLLAGIVGLCSGIGAGLAYVHVKQLGNLHEPDWRTVFYFTLISTIGAGIWMLFDQVSVVTWHDLPILLGLAGSATLAQLALTRAYRTGKTLTVASLSYATVVISSLFGILFWAEHLSASEWLAIGLIMIGGVLSTYSAQQAEPIVAENPDH